MKNRRQFGLQLVAGFCAAKSYGMPKKETPNFLMILVDDLGWSELSESMDPRIKEAQSTYLETPNINRLGREGMRFISGYSPAPLCTPTRRCIQCGTTAARSGSEFKSSWIPAEHLTIPKALKQVNPAYHCAHFGKWGEQMISTPEECGYDVSDGLTGNATGGMGDKNKPVHIVEDPKRTASLTDRAIKFMASQKKAGNPFYLQVSYYAPHLRVETTQTMLDKYLKKGPPDRAYTAAWAAMLEELDYGIGRLLDTVDQLEIRNNTYVVFMADNGGRGSIPGGDPSRKPPNFPLSGAKHHLFEGGVRVPFIVRGPGIKSGTICRIPVTGYDLLPTFYDLAGGRKPLPEEIDGVSFRILFRDPYQKELGRRNNAIFFHRPGRGFSTVRQGDYKLFLYWNKDGSIKSRELYKLEPNPVEEGNDIAAANPEKTAQLEKILLNYLKSVNAETPQSLPKKKKKRAAKKGIRKKKMKE